MKITRREALRLGLVSGGMLLSPLGFANSAQAQADPCATTMLPPSTQVPPISPTIDRFQQPLRIMEPLKQVLSKTYKVTREGITFDQPIDYYEITMRKQTIELIPARNGKPAITTDIWSYNGTLPGPLIRQQKNRESCIRFKNELGQDADGKDICTSVHLHGMASLPQYDGYAEDITPVGYYKDYYYPNNRASILWYHDHAVHKTSRNVYMGLAGMYIVEYAEEDFCRAADAKCMPSGEFEVPLVIQDVTFKQPQTGDPNHWELVFNDRRQRGVYADVTLVNGVPFPYFPVKRRKYFFRLLNASASRTFQLALSREENSLTLAEDALIVVGSDAGLLGKPAVITAPKSLPMGVAERYGVIVDFSKFPANVKQVYLRDLGFSGNLGPTPKSLLRFDLQDDPVTDSCIIPSDRLGILTLQQALIDRSVRTRTFRFGRGNQWTINGRGWESNFVSADPGQGDIEIWTLINTGGWTHPVHIHLIDFQILDRNGMEPAEHERGWKDVVLLRDGEVVRVIARFAPHRGKYMMHCHNIVHEDHDMMTQFEVGQGGTSPLADRAKPLPAPELGSTQPPNLLEDKLPCKAVEPLPNNCDIVIPPLDRCKPPSS
ncbi:MAG: multicopper oxidase domain-containing protein [Scytolyngbya sp. HA4215-MV1]|nr:multicopper oxidase domain-containing protein [Scytolyngbya sp. HA4215-MV1]